MSPGVLADDDSELAPVSLEVAAAAAAAADFFFFKISANDGPAPQPPPPLPPPPSLPAVGFAFDTAAEAVPRVAVPSLSFPLGAAAPPLAPPLLRALRPFRPGDVEALPDVFVFDSDDGEASASFFSAETLGVGTATTGGTPGFSHPRRGLGADEAEAVDLLDREAGAGADADDVDAPPDTLDLEGRPPRVPLRPPEVDEAAEGPSVEGPPELLLEEALEEGPGRCDAVEGGFNTAAA